MFMTSRTVSFFLTIHSKELSLRDEPLEAYLRQLVLVAPAGAWDPRALALVANAFAWLASASSSSRCCV
jgi:hypothetical protein